jgi:hypothetical protein
LAGAFLASMFAARPAMEECAVLAFECFVIALIRAIQEA